jgi:hypothetical protein
MDRAVAYYRVSTKQQHRSGLGIEAQRAAVTRFAESEGFTIISEYVEAETGKGADALERRPQLAAALAAAKSAKCSVLVSKLDRLSRDVAFAGWLAVDSTRRGRSLRREHIADDPYHSTHWSIGMVSIARQLNRRGIRTSRGARRWSTYSALRTTWRESLRPITFMGGKLRAARRFLNTVAPLLQTRSWCLEPPHLSAEFADETR